MKKCQLQALLRRRSLKTIPAGCYCDYWPCPWKPWLLLFSSKFSTETSSPKFYPLESRGSKLLEAWAELPESVKTAVLEMVRG